MTRPDGAGGLLAIYAHPDDESFGSAGVMALAVEAGVPVDLVCATDGDLGGPADAPDRRSGGRAVRAFPESRGRDGDRRRVQAAGIGRGRHDSGRIGRLLRGVLRAGAGAALERHAVVETEREIEQHDEEQQRHRHGEGELDRHVAALVEPAWLGAQFRLRHGSGPLGSRPGAVLPPPPRHSTRLTARVVTGFTP